MPCIRAVLVIVMTIGLVGCGKAEPEKPAPLSVAEWTKMPLETKYEIDTLERLKLGDPKLTNEEAWDDFTRRVILPNRKKDAAKSKAKS